MRIVFGIVENFLEGGTGANATEVNFVVFDSADHVHVEHGDSFVERLGGIFDPGGGTEEAEFLTSEGGEENAALELAFHGGEEAGEFEKTGLAKMSEGLAIIDEIEKPVDWNAMIDQEFLPKDLQKPL